MGAKKNPNDQYQFFQKITKYGLQDIEIEKQIPAEAKKKTKIIIKEENLGDPRKLYTFSGSILNFGQLVASNFNASTLAVSESKARTNFLFQAKKKLGLVPSAGGITLKGTIKELPRNNNDR